MSESEFFSVGDFSFADSFTDIRKVYSSPKGHTEVYEARKALKRFALKALKPEFRKAPFYVGLLRKEFEIGFRLEHPGIVHTYSFEEVDGLGLCIVLEWVDGDTLGTHITGQTIDEGEWRKVFLEICEAFMYLEKRQVVHRDIKPSNIMLTSDGHHAKLIDFGFADSPEYGVLKHSGGTRDYAAPEQILNTEIKSTTDIYALGKILGELPVRKNKKFKRLIRRMTSEQPSERPQSVEDIKDELGKVFHGANRNIYIVVLTILIVMIAAVVFMVTRTNNHKIEDNQEVVTESPGDTILPEIQPERANEPGKISAPVEQPTVNSHHEQSIEPESEKSITPAEEKNKRVVHWMVLLTAQQTRGTARKYQEQGDDLWEEHTRQEIGEWVDSQTETSPELRQECHDEINDILEKIKREEPG